MNTLKVGDKVPGFSAKNQDGNTINLSDYKGKKLVVFSILKQILQDVPLRHVIYVIIILNYNLKDMNY